MKKFIKIIIILTVKRSNNLYFIMIVTVQTFDGNTFFRHLEKSCIHVLDWFFVEFIVWQLTSVIQLKIHSINTNAWS